jgi:hypothetical protein
MLKDKHAFVFALFLGIVFAGRIIDSDALKVIADDPKEVSYFWHMLVKKRNLNLLTL